MKAILSIDTTQSDATYVSIQTDKGTFEKTSHSRVLKSQTVLPLIEELLSDQHLAISDISEILVKTGPGSFTGIRVGISIANILATLLKITVNGKHTLAIPQY